HVLHRDDRLTRDVPGEVTRERTRVRVEATARGVDHDADGLVAVEVRAELPRALAGRSDAERQSRRGGEGRPEGPGAGEGSGKGGRDRWLAPPAFLAFTPNAGRAA